jgi:hypothetical protein
MTEMEKVHAELKRLNKKYLDEIAEQMKNEGHSSPYSESAFQATHEAIIIFDHFKKETDLFKNR